MHDELKPSPAPANAFRELGRRSLSRDAAEHLKQVILDGSLAPGERLPPERELATRLGVSRPTLREAVSALVIMGLLESRHGAGTFVAGGAGEVANGTTVTIDIREDPLAALFELRLLFEPVAAAKAAARITDAELAELARLLEQLETHVADADEFVRIDAAFHRVIQVVARSPLMLATFESIGELALRGRTISGRQRVVRERTIAEHRVILEALRARDPFEAQAAMTAHIMHIRGTMIGQAT